MPVEDDKLVFKKSGDSLDITIPEEIFRAEGLSVIKHFTQLDLFKFVSSIKKINFIETYSNNQPPKPKENSESK